LYASELATWLWTILLRGAAARPYNVGSERAVSISELARVVSDVVAPTGRIERAQEPTPGKPAARYVPSTARARAELGLEQRVELPEALARTARWLRGGAS
jgi:dTDP-glucose 4,6-dehydratase